MNDAILCNEFKLHALRKCMIFDKREEKPCINHMNRLIVQLRSSVKFNGCWCGRFGGLVHKWASVEKIEETDKLKLSKKWEAHMHGRWLRTSSTDLAIRHLMERKEREEARANKKDNQCTVINGEREKKVYVVMHEISENGSNKITSKQQTLNVGHTHSPALFYGRAFVHVHLFRKEAQ